MRRRAVVARVTSVTSVTEVELENRRGQGTGWTGVWTTAPVTLVTDVTLAGGAEASVTSVT